MQNRSMQAVYAAVLNQDTLNPPGIGTHDIADQAGVCYSTAVRLLNQLKAEGKVHSTGSKHKLWFPVPINSFRGS